MNWIHFICQNCNTQHEKIMDFKTHVQSYSHKQEVAKYFHTAVHGGAASCPRFLFLDYLKMHHKAKPLIGFNAITMFIAPEKNGAFYICHVCKERINIVDIVQHLCSDRHYLRYLASNNPEMLCFAWPNDSFSYLQSCATEEYKTNGFGKLRVFELPKMMLKRSKTLLYSQVMTVFSKMDKLTERIQAGVPPTKSIQEYIADPARTHPLLGLNQLLEYSCPVNEECAYLCNVCKQKLSDTQVIFHCISFDHVSLCLKTAHPDILKSPKSHYNQCKSLQKKILHLANRAQTVSPPTEIQNIHVDLESFKVIGSLSYACALEKLQIIQRERKQSELNVTTAPGEPIMSASKDESSAHTAQKVEKAKMGSVTQRSVNPQCRISCVECNLSLNFLKDYKQHIKEKQHNRKLLELFGPGQYRGTLSQIKLYQQIWSRKMSSPLLGLPLLTVFVQRQSVDIPSPLYLCHACELNIPVSSVFIHMTEHYLNVISYSKPDLVFLQTRNLAQFAREEEWSEENMVLQVCELPGHQLRELKTLAYEKIMEIIWSQFPKLRKYIPVKKRVTLQSFSKIFKRKSPLLGLQFMVKCTTTGQHYFKCSYLCLLCKMKFLERDAIKHVLSFGHIYNYLDKAHPGSLSKGDSEKVSLIMDLAQQAEKITPNVTLQEVEVSAGKFKAIQRDSFMTAVNELEVVFRKNGRGELQPSVIPGPRLVSSFDGQQENNLSKCKEQGHTSDTENLIVDGTSTDISKTKKKINLPAGHMEHLKSTSLDLTHKQSVDPSLAITHFDMTSSQPSVSSLHEPPEPLKLDHKSVDQRYSSLTEDLPSLNHLNIQDSGPPHEQNVELGKKTTIEVEALQMPEQCPACLSAETPVATDSQTHFSTCIGLRCYLLRPDRRPVIGLKSVIECRTVGQEPFYVCLTCAERCATSTIIEHILSDKHRLQYLESIGYCSESGKRVRTKWLQDQAEKVEKLQGCGETEILNLDFKDYDEISNAQNITALGKLRDSLLKLTSEISAQSPKAACSDGAKRGESEFETFKRAGEPEEKDFPYSHLKQNVKSTEPETTEQNPDDPARNSPHLWSYLTSTTRTEPVIGLSMVTEYRNSSGQHSFLCSCCEVILATNNYESHLNNSHHRFNYIKIKYPEIVKQWKGEICLLTRGVELKQKARVIEDCEGWGCLKVVEKEIKLPQKRTLESSEDYENSTKAPKLEPSQTGDDEPHDHNGSETKPTKLNKKKVIRRHNVMGLNFVTCVYHEKKKLFFCDLCIFRGHFDHISSVSHRNAFMNHTFPYLVANGANMDKVRKAALHLAAAERSTETGMKKLQVSAKVFSGLRTAPLSEALNQLKLLQQEAGVNLKSPFHFEPSSLSNIDHALSSSTKIHTRSYQDNHISPSPSLSCNTISSSLLSPSLSNVPHLPSSQTDSLAQCLFEASPLYEQTSPSASGCQYITSVSPPHSYSACRVYEPVSPLPVPDSQHITSIDPPDFYSASPVYESISPPPASVSMDSTNEVPSYSSKHPIINKPYRLKREQPADVCNQSSLMEKKKRLCDTIYCLPNLPRASGQSYASMFLSVKEHNKDLVIGLSNVWECRSISQPTFYLCLNCAEKVSRNNFCDHITSEQHQYLTIRTQYPETFQHWQLHTIDHMTICDLSKELALLEKGLDAKIIKLNQDQYKSLCSADFQDAIEILQWMFGPCLDDRAEASHLVNQSQNQRNNAFCGPDVTPNLEAKNSKEPTGDSLKHIDMKHINKNRTGADAVVGRSAVIECRTEGHPSLYVCVSCSTKLNHNHVNYHLVKPDHRYNYLTRRYPSLFNDWSDSESRHVRSTKLMRLAHKVKMSNEDEPGQLQVMKLNSDDLKSIQAMSYDEAIIHLQKIRKEQNNCALITCIFPEITEGYQSQQVHQTFQHPDTDDTFHACSSSSQAGNNENVISTPAFQHGVYPLATRQHNN